MATWTAPVTHATGDILSASDWNGVANNEIFLYQAPYANYYASAGTALTSSTAQAIVSLGSTAHSNYGFSLSSSTAICPLTGIYFAAGKVALSSGAGSGATYVQADLILNGSTLLYGSVNPSYSTFPGSNVSGTMSVTAGGAVALYAAQNSGSSLTTLTGIGQTFLSLFFVGSN